MKNKCERICKYLGKMGSKEIRMTFRNLAIQGFQAKYLVKVISA